MAQRTALCGHSYYGSRRAPAWARCTTCMRAMRRVMHWENEERRRLLAERPESSSSSYYIPTRVRQRVYERDAWTCQLCLDPVDATLPHSDIWSASLDHIICRSWVDEADHSESNLRLAHRWCNSVRGNEAHHSPDVLLPPERAA